jgi:hypothetical protein
MELRRGRAAHENYTGSISGYLVIWLSGYLVIWLSGYLVIWLSGHLQGTLNAER